MYNYDKAKDVFPELRSFTKNESKTYNEFINNLFKNQKDLDSEIVEMVDNYFWELV